MTEPKPREALAREFLDPSSEYGPIDGWWWEAGRLDRERLTWQLEELKAKGVAGTWFYPRYIHGEPLGCDPPYFSDEWWEFVRFVTEEHKRLGMTSWFSNWELLSFTKDRVRAGRDDSPSLWGHRLIAVEGAAAGDGALTLELEAEDEVLDVAAYRLDEEALDYGSRVDLNDSLTGQKVDWSAPDPGWSVIAVVARRWDLDYTSREVGALWTEVFMGEYDRRLSEYMGDPLEAFGVDELAMLEGAALFSDAIAARIEADRGYDPRPHLVGLFHDIGAKTDQVRCDYYDAMSSLLEENFHRPATEWLEQRGMKHSTLSQLGAEDPLEQVIQYGDIFRYLRTFHAPGNEDPFRTRAGDRRLFQSKLSSSIAHLYGNQRAVVLAHYGSGWGVTLQENLAWSNETYAYGLNLYSRTLAMYSLMGGWYEYVPPGDHFYHPYWRYWRTFADYLRRLSFILSQGTHAADVALLYPIATFHANLIAGRDSRAESETVEVEDTPGGAFERPAKECADGLMQLAREIYHHGIDFDVVDDESIANATVRDGVIEIAGIEFRSVVLPPMTTVRRTTVEKLKELHDQGGTVVASGRIPTASVESGRDDPELRAMLDPILGGEAAEPARVPAILSERLVRDLVASERGIFHTHRRVGELDVYFVYNAGAQFSTKGPPEFFGGESVRDSRGSLDDVREEDREVELRLRVDADVERWDALTGERHPVHRVRHDGDRTTVRLGLSPYEAAVLVCSPRSDRPVVVDDEGLDEILAVEAGDGGVAVRALATSGGSKRARVSNGSSELALQGEAAPVPPEIEVAGPFGFTLEPTMDNRWGDYRHPPSARTLGAEARRFRYREEQSGRGTDLGWHLPGHSDAEWELVTYSYGPHWWHLGPIDASGEPAGLVETAGAGDVRAWHRWWGGTGWIEWQPCTFSKELGAERTLPPAMLPPDFQHLLGVPENLLVFESPPGGDSFHYFQTTVLPDADGEYELAIGKLNEHDFVSGMGASFLPYSVPAGTTAWVNGEQVLSVEDDDAGAEVRSKVPLRAGPNSVLLRIAHPGGGVGGNYAVFLNSGEAEPERYVPRVRWAEDLSSLAYDIHGGGAPRVGWYRFCAPPGLHRMRVPADTKVLEAWVDGEAATVDGAVISLAQPATAASQVALRVEQQPGLYGGAAFSQPVEFECAGGEISAGDWSDAGLDTYSGIGVYRFEVELTDDHLECAVVLDLGQVKTAAELFVNGQPAGVRLASPFRFDVTELVRPGTNRFEVKVANTLANHMSTYPTIWVLPGQTTSGLLGPGRLRFLRRVELSARQSSA